MALLRLFSFPETDHANTIVPVRKNQHVKRISDETDGPLAKLAVILAIIDVDDGRIPLEVVDGLEVDTVLAPVGPILCLVPFVVQGSVPQVALKKVYTNKARSQRRWEPAWAGLETFA